MDKSHAVALETKHHSLESRIEAEHKRPLPDELTLAKMKKEKLRLKDELQSG